MTKKDDKVCCPKFDPAPWDEKEFVWKDKLFVKDSVRSFLHVPLNMGQVITRMWQQIEKADARPADEDLLMLSDETSAWKSDQLISVAKEVADMENVKMSGKFLTKVFEGQYKDVPNWHREMNNYVKGKGKEVKKIYSYYTTCPKCAKKYGKNYVVLFAEV